MPYEWLSDPDDERHLATLRDRAGKDAARVLIFLGAGLSFGVGRYLGRASFERPQPYDDDRFPSWPDLIERMRRRVVADTDDPHEATAFDSFFEHNDYLDCAQLFRATVGRSEYNAFLESQFGTSAEDEGNLTASHEALVRIRSGNSLRRTTTSSSSWPSPRAVKRSWSARVLTNSSGTTPIVPDTIS